MKNNSAVHALASFAPAAERFLFKIKTVSLARNEVMRLERSSGIKTVEAKNGVVWLTGSPAESDVLLQNGERFELQNRWPYVIEALEQAEIVLFHG